MIFVMDYPRYLFLLISLICIGLALGLNYWLPKKFKRAFTIFIFLGMLVIQTASLIKIAVIF